MWDQAAGTAVLQTAEITVFLCSLEGKKKQDSCSFSQTQYSLGIFFFPIATYSLIRAGILLMAEVVRWHLNARILHCCPLLNYLH